MSAIGLDFGTGNSVLAIYRSGMCQVFQVIERENSTPSDVLVSTAGAIDPDPHKLYDPPSGFRREGAIKRRLLSMFTSDSNGRDYLMDLAVTRLKYVYDAFTQKSGEMVHKAVLTCPANTGQAYRDILLEIGRRIGLPEVDIVDEPTAAAVHHGLSERTSQTERWMVVDWGCGTCDVSLIERRAGQADLVVQCVKGDNALGGLDMDGLLRDHLAERYRFDPAVCPPWQVEALKKHLSDQEKATATLTMDDGRSLEVTVTRFELESLIAPLLRRAEGLIAGALAEVRWRDVDQVIATGGPMLMPSVRQTIAHAIDWDEEDILWRDPLTSVAQGAARLAELKRVGGLVVTNQVAQTIGVRVVQNGNDDAYHPIIRRGETRPVTRDVHLATSVDLQDIIAIELREGDNISALSNALLGRLNVVVRPENRGAVQVCLRVRLSDSGLMEALVEPKGDPNTVRQVHAAGIRVEQRSTQEAQAELRLSDPVQEFHAQVNEREVDPDTARQIYDRLKIKYHPSRQPEKSAYWNARLAAMDEAFNEYMAEVQRRVRASTLPDLPWDDLGALQRIVVDEVLAQRLTHCLALGIGGEARRTQLVTLLRRFPDYRRILASYLSAMKRNTTLQELLATDDRPHVGLIVLLENLSGKPLRERHEALKAVYRLPVEQVQEMLADPHLDVQHLYVLVPQVAPAPETLFGMPQRRGRATGEQHVSISPAKGDTRSMKLTYERDWTWIYEDVSGMETKLKGLGFIFSGKRNAWFAKRHVEPSEFD